MRAQIGICLGGSCSGTLYASKGFLLLFLGVFRCLSIKGGRDRANMGCLIMNLKAVNCEVCWLCFYSFQHKEVENVKTRTHHRNLFSSLCPYIFVLSGSTNGVCFRLISSCYSFLTRNRKQTFLFC